MPIRFRESAVSFNSPTILALNSNCRLFERLIGGFASSFRTERQSFGFLESLTNMISSLFEIQERQNNRRGGSSLNTALTIARLVVGFVRCGLVGSGPETHLLKNVCEQ